MKFAVKLRKKMIPEWQDAYLSYDLLKTLLKPFKKTSKLCSKMIENQFKTFKRHLSAEAIDKEDIDGLKDFEDKFEALLLSEINKINNFFHMKLLECKKEWEYIRFNCILYYPVRHNNSNQEGKQIKNAIFIFYKKLDFLMEYMNLNMEGVRKVLKKHHKICKTFEKNIKLMDKNPKDFFKDSYITHNSELLLRLKDDVKRMYIDLFYHRYNKHLGHKDLKEITKTRIISVWESHFYFFFTGSTATLFIVILVMSLCGDIDPDDNATFENIFPMFRGAAFIIVYIWLLGWNVYGWTRYHVNYKRMFKFNYHCSAVKEILKRGTFFSSVFMITFIWYVILNENAEPLSDYLSFMNKAYVPAIIWVLILGYLFFPCPYVFNWEGRKYFYKLLFRIFFLSFFTVDFTMGWATDQMVSFVTPIKDLEYTFCYYFSHRIDSDKDIPSPGECSFNTFVIAFVAAFIPVFYRMVQCTRSLLNKKKLFDPDLLNFFKYFFTLLVAIFSYLYGKYNQDSHLLYAWIAVAVVSTVYSYVWDLKMDWGLLQPSKKSKYLREKLIYPRVWVYYFAIIVNLFLRFAWILTISPALVAHIMKMRKELMTFIVGSLEMFRRSMWNFLRVEKEFILNSENYQALESYTLPYKFDTTHSFEENLKFSLSSSGFNRKNKAKKITFEDNEDEFRRNFGVFQSTDMRFPLLKANESDFNSSKVSKNNAARKVSNNEISLLMEYQTNAKKAGNSPKNANNYSNSNNNSKEISHKSLNTIEEKESNEIYVEKKGEEIFEEEKGTVNAINRENESDFTVIKEDTPQKEKESPIFKLNKKLEKESIFPLILRKLLIISYKNSGGRRIEGTIAQKHRKS